MFLKQTFFIAEFVRMKMASTLSSKVEQIEDELTILAEDTMKSEIERVGAYIDLATIWGNRISSELLKFMCYNVSNSGIKLDSTLDIVDLCHSYTNHLRLIDTIAIDREKCVDNKWLQWYSTLVYNCFHPHSNRFVENTEFISQLRHRICQLIVEKMRFILLDDQIWTNNDDCSIGYGPFLMLSIFTLMLTAYRIELDANDLQLLRKRFDQLMTANPNHSFIHRTIDRMKQIDAIKDNTNCE